MSSKNPFELAQELEPLDIAKNPDRFMAQVTKFGEWVAALPNEPVQITLTVHPFDCTVRGWTYRTFTEDEKKEMVPCHRLFVHCMDMWGEKIMSSDVVVAQPPVEDEGNTTEWLTGIAALLYEAPATVATVQTEMLSALFKAHGFNSEKFLEDTADSLTVRQQLDALEAMMYVCDLEDQVVTAAPDDPFTDFMVNCAKAVRMFLSEKWGGFLKEGE